MSEPRAAARAAELWRRVSRALDEVWELEGDARLAFLERLQREDPEVHREALALMAADPGTSRRLVGAVHAAAADLPPTAGGTLPAGAPGEPTVQIGDWRVLHRIGRGGMGEVFLAERADGAYEQRAALKLLKRGLDSEELLARFLRERQILARLEHPGIARLLDGGVASDDRPYFVLEFVDGAPITDHAEAAGLGVEACLRLFLEVCAAVESAHRSLVVHRDLKPSNILVTAAGEVKLLDFGIAKLLEDEGEAAVTRTELRLLTPAYAAPEQIVGGNVTTATDVFALGAVLYELLTGRRPFARAGRTPTDLAREVEREHAERPSAVTRERARAAATDADRAALLARARRLGGDLDAILLEALEPDPHRRYPTVDAFAADLERALDGRPVRARADGWTYRARKFAGRHRLALGAAALVGLSLVAGLAAALWQAARAAREARRAERVQEFLVGMFEGADPSRSLGDRLSARELVEKGVARIDRELAAEPEAHAELLDVGARALWQLGRSEEAQPLAARAVREFDALAGPGASRTLLARLTLAEIEAESGRLAEARPFLETVVPRLEALLPPGAPELRRARMALSFALNETGEFERSLAELRAVAADLDSRGDGGESLEAVQVHQALGAVLYALSRAREAEAEYRRALGVLERLGGRDSALGVLVLSSLGEIVGRDGRTTESLGLQVEAIAVARRIYGDGSPVVARALLPYGHRLSECGRRAEAETVYREAAATFLREQHYDAAAALRYLGQDQLAEERFDEALASFEQAEAIARKVVGDDHFMTWGAVQARADALVKLGRLAEAEPLQRQALEAFERFFGPEGDFVRLPLRQLGENLRRQGHLEEALALHRRARAIERKLYGEKGSPSEAATLRELALDLLAVGTREAIVEARVAIELARTRLGGDATDPLRAGDLAATAARVSLAEGDRARARRELEQALALLEPERGPRAPSVVAARAALARLRG